ncbi:MAG: hypothetical protein V1685_02685 [Parcubacteria group bacterium]
MVSAFYPFIAYIVTALLPAEWFFAKALIALPLLVIVPEVIGRLFADWLLARTSHSLSSMSKYVLSWFSGMFIIFYFSYIAEAFNIFHWESLMLALTAVASSIRIFRLHRNIKPLSIKVNWGHAAVVICLLFVSISIFVFFRSFSAFPLQSGSDNIFLGGLSAEILQNDLSNSNFYIYSYLPFIPFLLSITSVFGHVQPIHVLWFAPLLLYCVFGYGLYSFLIRKTGSRIVALTVAASWILLFGHEGRLIDLINFREKNLLYALIPFFLIFVEECVGRIRGTDRRAWQLPAALGISGFVIAIQTLFLTHPFTQTMVIVGILLIAFVVVKPQHTHPYLPAVFLVSIMIVLTHVYSGLFVVVAAAGICTLLVQMPPKFAKIVTACVFILISLFVYSVTTNANYNPSIGGANSDDIIFGGRYNYNFSTKQDLVTSSIPLPILILGVLGIIMGGSTYRKVVSVYGAALVFCLVLIFAPINFSFRLIEIASVFLALFVAVAFHGLIRPSNQPGFVYSRIAVTVMIIVMFVSAALLPIRYVEWIFDQGIASRAVGMTNFTNPEYQAAMWVQKQYPRNTLIFTSPELTRSFTALSGKTIMLRGMVKEYSYLVKYTPPATSRCRSVTINGYHISPSVVPGTRDYQFEVNTFIKDWSPYNTNIVELSPCSVGEVPVLSLIHAGKNMETIEGSVGDNSVVFTFSDFEDSLKNYSIAIFDNSDDLRELRRKIFSEKSAQEAVVIAKSVTNYYRDGLRGQLTADELATLHPLIIVSGAAARWGKGELVTYNMAVPFEPYDGFEKFNDIRYFNRVFSIPGEVYVYELIN